MSVSSSHPGELPGVAGYLASATELAVRFVPGVVAASVTLVSGPQPRTPAHCGPLALDLDQVQYRLGRGPCLQAASTGDLVEVVDAGTDRRWPGYPGAAAARGVRSSLSVPLPLSGTSTGALNLYGEQAGAFADPEARRSAGAVGDTAAAGLTALLDLASAATLAGNLEVAMASRETIEQAKGVLIERHRISPDEAFQLLRRASQRANRKLRDVADHLVATGELLQP